jgi:proline iminopeptidase
MIAYASRGLTQAHKIGGKLLPINGTKLWVADVGPRAAPVLLYIHGGPGVGSLDFEHYMLPHLAGRVRLVSVDQRGVLRSDPITTGTQVTVEQLIADFETIRTTLSIPRWQVLGHSFGGMVALRYALAHPARIERLILECPSIDLASSFRWLSAAAAQALNGRDTAAAARASNLADPSRPFDDGFIAEMDEVLRALGPRRQDLYVYAPANRDIFSRLAAQAGLPEERWQQGAIPGKSLLAQPSTRMPMLGKVSAWRGPLLLVRGEGDHVTSPQELLAVERARGRIVTVPKAGHFIHVEAPAALGNAITDRS